RRRNARKFSMKSRGELRALDGIGLGADLERQRTRRGERRIRLHRQLLHAREIVVAEQDDGLIRRVPDEPAQEELSLATDLGTAARTEVEMIADGEQPDVVAQHAALRIDQIVKTEHLEEAIERRLRISEREPTRPRPLRRADRTPRRARELL